MTFVVALDGPAGSGKSSVSKAAARHLGFAYLDTGAAYRAVTWHVVHCGANLASQDDIVACLPSFDYSCSTDPESSTFRVGVTDVTEAIRGAEVTNAVSTVARVPAVRDHVNAFFRRTIEQTEKPGIIVEGRDITTVVVPKAPVRILLTASEEVRAHRRTAELESATQATLRARDAADAQVSQFLTAADGVITLDSTNLGFAETVAALVGLIEKARQS